MNVLERLARSPLNALEFANIVLTTDDAVVGATPRDVIWTHRGTTLYRYRSSGDPQVAQHRIGEVRADPRQCGNVLRAAGHHQAEARLGDEFVERLRGTRLGLLVERPNLRLGRG